MKKLPAILFIGILILSGCLEEFGDLDKDTSLTLSPRVGFPLIDSRIFFKDFEEEIKDFEITSSENGTIVLSYFQDIFEASAEDYFSVLQQASPAVTITGLSSGGLPLTGTMDASGSDVLQVEVDGEERIDSARIKSGTLKLVVNSTYTVDTKVTFVIDALLVSGQPLTYEMIIVPGNNEAFIDLQDSFFDLTLGGTEYNQLGFDVLLELSANGDVVLPIQSIEALFEIIDPRFSQIVGESGYRSIEDQTGTEPISTLGEAEIGNFVVAEPSVELTIVNSFGVQFEVDLAALSILTKDGQTKTLAGDIVDVQNPFQISGSDFTNIGGSVETVLTVNNANSNISDLVSSIPTEFSYQATATYPGGVDKIYILDTSKVSIRGKAIVPLYGSVMDLKVSKEFDFEIGEDFEELLEAEIKIVTENRYPLGVELTLNFLNQSGNVLLRLLADNPSITEAAPVDLNGSALSSSANEVIISLAEADFEILKNVKSLRVDFGLNTTGDGNTLVRIRNEDYLDLKLSVSGKLKLGL